MWKSLSRYHPRIGYTLMPSVKSRVPWETGGYLLQTNAAGFRSNREFVKERTPGKFRAILFGDSMTAGDGVANADRYSDQLEAMVPHLEVYNYGLPGTGTDQHYIAFQDCADVEYDLLVIGLYVENIGRVANRFRTFAGERGEKVIYAKPYFLLENDELTLHHIPVPKAALTKESMSPEDLKHVNWGVPHAGLREVVKKLGLRDLAQKITRFQPLPEYASPDHPDWKLLSKIVSNWAGESRAPVLIVLLPMWPFTEESSDPTPYQARYRELAAQIGCYLHDPLPDLWKYTPEERRAFRFKVDSHYTPAGHKAIAASIAPTIERIMAEHPAPQS
ncbi:MAG: SGNH/GDSL hydrolase family protein [Pirellulales bacterium]|nr:SGNH/GDSL hydrolase family protein [Pirellulales bacterium]